jgi:Periplasmic binding protein
MKRSLLAVVLAASLALAACSGSNSSDADTSDADTSDADTSDAASSGQVTTTEATATTGQSTGAATTVQADGPTAPIELADSYQGVTKDSISIGVGHIDFERVSKEFGFEQPTFPVDIAYNAWATTLNAGGGINGRQVKIETRGFLPVGATETDEACVELLEDKKVFVVIGDFPGDSMLCVTEARGHPYVGLYGDTPALQEASKGLMFGVQMSRYDQRIAATQLMLDEGSLEGLKVGIVWTDPTEKPAADAIGAMLDEAGIQRGSDVEVGSMTPDAVANEAAWTATFERLESEGTDLFISLGDLAGLGAVSTFSPSVDIAVTTSQIAEGDRFVGSLPPNDEARSAALAVAVYQQPAAELLTDPEAQRCVDEYNAASPPDGALDTSDQALVYAFIAHCRAFRLTVEALGAAGGDITPETFKTAAEGLGAVALPGMAEASLGPDKHSAGSQVAMYAYDADAGHYVVSGEPVTFGG